VNFEAAETPLYIAVRSPQVELRPRPPIPDFLLLLAPCLMRHSLLLLLGFPAVVAAFTAQHRGRLPERRSESGAKRDVNAVRRDPNRFANPNAASELRPFKFVYFLSA